MQTSVPLQHPTPGGRPDDLDRGAAMIITLMVLMLVGALGTTVLKVTVANLSATKRLQDSNLALDAADAGLTQAVALLRSTAGRGLTGAVPCTQTAWRTAATSFTGVVDAVTSQSYDVWIAPCTGPDPQTKVFKVTSRGKGRTGVRVVQQEVVLGLRGVGFPLGVFGRTIDVSGTAGVDNASVFSTGCVAGRKHLNFNSGGIDAAYGLPVAAHSTQYVTDDSKTSPCGPSQSIHQSSACSVKYPYDHDLAGGPCLGPALQYPTYYGKRDLDGDGDVDVDGTKLVDDKAMFDLFNMKEDPVPLDKLQELKSVAQSQVDGTHSNYYTDPKDFKDPPDPAKYANAVLYFDLQGSAVGKTVNLKDLGNVWKPDGTTCANRSLLIIIDNGNVEFSGGHEIAANIVLTSRTYGNVDKFTGGGTLIGSIYANKIDVSGNYTFKLDSCSLGNISPALYSAETRGYVELDR